MRWLFVALILLSATSAADARWVRMTVGKDAFVFDRDFRGRLINVYELSDDEPYSDLTEGIMHDWFIVQDIVKAGPGLKINFVMGRTADIPNAYATIYFISGKPIRYIVINPGWYIDHYARIYVIGHEMGHHVCGHQEGVMANDPWARELEADRFSGMILRHMESTNTLNFSDTLQRSLQYIDENPSPTHPPRSMRVAAIIQGYNEGSPCLGREVTSGPTGSVGTLSPSIVQPLWNHNGSTMRLFADGAVRKFLYESPREGLAGVGVSKGTLLFSGIKSGNAYSGTAYVFSRCGAKPYQVSGPVSDDQRQVTLYGQAPIPDSNCRISSHRSDSLMFTFVGD